MKDFLSIKEFSRLSGIETTTLRYWDEIGLFCPAKRNPENNYRYYEPAQVIAVNFITVMGNLHVPLKTIDEIQVRRDPESIMALIEQQENLLALKMRRLQEAASVIHMRRSLIKAGLKAEVTEISVQELPQRALILGPPNTGFSAEGGFYLPFMKFCNQAKELRINLNYPIGARHSNLEAFCQAPSEPQHFFSLDPTGNACWPGGTYLVGYARGYYGNFGTMPEKMAAEAKKRGLRCTGPLYTIYLHDEICLEDPAHYLSQISVAVV